MSASGAGASAGRPVGAQSAAIGGAIGHKKRLVRGRLMPVLGGKACIALANMGIRNIGIPLGLGTRLQMLFALVSAVGADALAFNIGLWQTNGLHRRFGSSQPWRPMSIILTVAQGLRMEMTCYCASTNAWPL